MAHLRGSTRTARDLSVTTTNDPSPSIDMPLQARRSDDVPTLLRVCSDRGNPQRPSPEQEMTAIEERPDNVDVELVETPMRTFMALVTHQMWETGRRLRVRFIDGDPAVHSKVMAVAQQWTAHAALRLEASRDPDAEIRVSFAQRGQSWSWIGTGALNVPGGEATMNYGWLDAGTGDQEYQRVVLHEFGHALGCVHEHQSPNAGTIPWDVQAVYAYYKRTNGWDKAMVDSNVLGRYSASWIKATAFDRESIMLYPVPEELTVGTWSTPWNGRLSEQDKRFIAQQYPGAAPAEPVELVVDGPPCQAELSVAGETDTYAFDVPTRARHILHTDGPTDTVMRLYGPDDPAALVAADFDRGRGANARIVRALSPGRYLVRVRHQTTTGDGAYAIRVRTKAL